MSRTGLHLWKISVKSRIRSSSQFTNFLTLYLCLDVLSNSICSNERHAKSGLFISYFSFNVSYKLNIIIFSLQKWMDNELCVFFFKRMLSLFWCSRKCSQKNLSNDFNMLKNKRNRRKSFRRNSKNFSFSLHEHKIFKTWNMNNLNWIQKLLSFVKDFKNELNTQ